MGAEATCDYDYHFINYLSVRVDRGSVNVTGRTRGYEDTKDSEDGVMNCPKRKRAESK